MLCYFAHRKRRIVIDRILINQRVIYIYWLCGLFLQNPTSVFCVYQISLFSDIVRCLLRAVYIVCAFIYAIFVDDYVIINGRSYPVRLSKQIGRAIRVLYYLKSNVVCVLRLQTNCVLYCRLIYFYNCQISFVRYLKKIEWINK